MTKTHVSDSTGPEEWDYEEMSQRHEPLRDELRDYLEETRCGYFLRHPFYNSGVYDLDRCAVIHRMIDERAAEADTCFERQDWEGYIGCIEYSLQLDWFAKDAHLLPDDRYWSLLGGIYGAQKFTHNRRDVIDRLFRADRPGRKNLMDPSEREVLARFPGVVTVYRGYADDDDEGFADGIAWTLDRRHAVWYANWGQASDNPRVIAGKVRKEDIWAYFHGGDVLLPPEKVIRPRESYASNEKARTAWADFIKKPFDVEAWLRKANGTA